MKRYVMRECKGRMIETYRDGSYRLSKGDDFVIIRENMTEECMERWIAKLDDERFCRVIDKNLNRY